MGSRAYHEETFGPDPDGRRVGRAANALAGHYLSAFHSRVLGRADDPIAHTSVGVVDAVDPNVFETANAGFAQVMYEEFLRDPAAVGPEWRRLFESGVIGEAPDGNGAVAPASPDCPVRRAAVPAPGPAGVRPRPADRRLPPSRAPPPSSSPT